MKNVPIQTQKEAKELTIIVDDIPLKGMQSLTNIYQRCHVIVFQPTNYEEAKSDER